MKPLFFSAVIACGLTVGLAGYATACPLKPGTSEGQLKTRSYLIAFKTDPTEIVVGGTFLVELQVCNKSGTPFTGVVKATATMPIHKHGMNYTPSVNALGDGNFRLEGFVFHMQGKWQYAFDLVSEKKTETTLLDHNQK